MLVMGGLPSAFKLGNNKPPNAEADNYNQQTAENYKWTVHLLLLFLGRKGVLSVFISLNPRIRLNIKYTATAAIPAINSIPSGVSPRKRTPITMLPNAILPTSNSNFPMSSLSVVRFLSFFISVYGVEVEFALNNAICYPCGPCVVNGTTPCRSI